MSPELASAVARQIVAAARLSIAEGEDAPAANQLANRIAARIAELRQPALRRVINATGIVLHTGLGRAPLSRSAVTAAAAAAGYCDLEVDLESGERGDRQTHVHDLLCLLTGAESALVVNNNAAALYLTLNVLAYRREVIVSRGQLIEIGGSFRLPDIMARSGVRLTEVGTTNRTRAGDFDAAVTSRTALLLRAHPSNFRIIGFTESVSVAELAEVGRRRGIPVVDDLGNGLLWNWTDAGLPPEESVRDSLLAGADLVLVSGDKVLGGPQAGIILGSKALTARLAKSPLARVLRCEKMTLAALTATLQIYLKRSEVFAGIPVMQMLTAAPEALQQRAIILCERLQHKANWKVCEVRACRSEAGSGTLPAVELPSHAVCLVPAHLSLAHFARRLRTSSVPVIGAVKQNLLWLDVRTVADADIDLLAETAAAAAERLRT